MVVVGERDRRLWPAPIAALVAIACWCSCYGNSEPPVAPPPGQLVARLGNFASPTRMALAGGLLYVSDSRRGQVAVLTLAGERVGTLLGASEPLGVGVWEAPPDSDQPDLVYVGDQADGSVRVFSGGALAGALGGGAGELGKPNAIAVASDGEVHVVDSVAGEVAVYGADGVRRRSYGDGILAFPTDIALYERNGEIFVTDFEVRAVAVFDRDGNYLRWIDPPLNVLGDPAFLRPIGLGMSPGGGLFVVDNALGAVAAIDRNGRLEMLFGFRDNRYWTGELALPIDAVSDGNRLYVTSNRSGKVHVFGGGP